MDVRASIEGAGPVRGAPVRCASAFTGEGAAVSARPRRGTPSLGVDPSRPARASRPDEALSRARACSAATWEALGRLGAGEGIELPLSFCYETAGPGADRQLALELRAGSGYRAVAEPDGVSGSTPPLPLSRAVLDAWVEAMVLAGRRHGAVFTGWTATVSATDPRLARSRSSDEPRMVQAQDGPAHPALAAAPRGPERSALDAAGRRSGRPA